MSHIEQLKTQIHGLADQSRQGAGGLVGFKQRFEQSSQQVQVLIDHAQQPAEAHGAKLKEGNNPPTATTKTLRRDCVQEGWHRLSPGI